MDDWLDTAKRQSLFQLEASLDLWFDVPPELMERLKAWDREAEAALRDPVNIAYAEANFGKDLKMASLALAKRRSEAKSQRGDTQTGRRPVGFAGPF